jgi:hypothetical protein
MQEALRFEMNAPVEVNLQCEDGVVIAGRYGDRVKYTLADNRAMYLAPFVARRIRDLGIRAGEPFKICKRQLKNGNRKTVDWLVERLDAEGETQIERDLRDSIEIANEQHESSPTVPAAPMKRLTIMPLRTNSVPDAVPPGANGSSNDQSTRTEVPETDSGNQRPPETQLAHALKTAIAAAVDAEKFAKTLDYNIRFTTDDVRSMGITILIGMQQRQR